MNWVRLPSKLPVDIRLLSGLIDRIGSTDFDIALMYFINELSPIPIVELYGMTIEENSPPRIAGWSSLRADTWQRVEVYQNSLYKKDNTINHLPNDDDEGQFFVCCQTPEEIEDLSYREHFFGDPEFVAEVTVIHKERSVWKIGKFYLRDVLKSEQHLIDIGTIGALTFPLGARHALRGDNSLRQASRPKAEERLLTLLENRFPQLTPRERQVCALSILGNSTQAVAGMLSISPNTVITYRQRIYDRLGVNSTSSLVREII